jgi:hypothetical protein
MCFCFRELVSREFKVRVEVQALHVAEIIGEQAIQELDLGRVQEHADVDELARRDVLWTKGGLFLCPLSAIVPRKASRDAAKPAKQLPITNLKATFMPFAKSLTDSRGQLRVYCLSPIIKSHL